MFLNISQKNTLKKDKWKHPKTIKIYSQKTLCFQNKFLKNYFPSKNY